uniref:Uncharacterized protein n=1 Tax=virus sp. ctiha2 TaxID=2827299 RepID=A0A8S5RHB5_9VIRU|nr:MAG TPA: hypothetical protein [virus sp. ctiha2]
MCLYVVDNIMLTTLYLSVGSIPTSTLTFNVENKI